MDMTTQSLRQDVPRITLSVIFIGILITASFWILRPFITAMLWATMIVVTTWPVMLSVQQRLGNRRGLAVTIMTLVLLLLFIIPFSMAIFVIVDRADDIVAGVRSLATSTFPPPPDWLGKIPLAGNRIAAQWQELADHPAVMAERIAPYAKKIANWVVSQAGGVLLMVVQFLLTVIISAVLYATGETAAHGVCRFARRLGGQHGEDAVLLAGKAVRGVALGVVVTALIQSLLGGIGLAVSGVPAVAILTAVMFILCIAQVGPGFVLIPAVIWLFWQDQTLWGSLMIGWTVFCGTIDNFIRPILIKKGADLPLLLIFAGVIGGLVTFGVVGLFIGPVILAVTYTLLGAWIEQGEQQNAAAHPVEVD